MALTINLDSQIVVKTAAQWAIDATVYSQKRILVTSDEYYGTTDQRKFKIADGVQMWSNLDYVPISETLAQVLANNNHTNNQDITSPNGKSVASILNGGLTLKHTSTNTPFLDMGDGYVNSYTSTGGYYVTEAAIAVNKYFQVASAKSSIVHDTQIDLNAPSVNLSQETASRIAIVDASKNIKSADTTTYPSLTELTYVKGVTSDIQTQINTKVTSGGALGTPSSGTLTNCTGLPLSGVVGYEGYTLFTSGASFTPADATTYYIGVPNMQALPSTTANATRMTIPKAGTIKRIDYYTTTGGTAGSTETSTVSFRLNNTTDTTISNAVITSGGATIATFSNNALSIAVAEGDTFEIKWVTPSWATNPTIVRIAALIYIE